MVSKFFLLFLLIIAGLCSSCGYYSFKGSLPSYIKRVAIPLFDNNTAYPGIQQDLTNKVIDEFINDNTLEVTNEPLADIIIIGTITSVTQKTATIKTDETVTGYNLYVNVKVKCEDIKNNKNLWEKAISQYGIMSGTASQEERDLAINEAIEKIAEEIINQTLAYW
jgi:outer membrane lipopolysaccharide assembly protein LptE/RlpB